MLAVRFYACMRTTVVIPDPLLKKAKLHAVEHSTTFRALVIEGLEYVLAKPAGTAAPPELSRPAEAGPPIGDLGSFGEDDENEDHGSAPSNVDIHRLVDL